MARTSFISGTVYEVNYPDGQEDLLEQAYNAFWDFGAEMPEGFEIYESDVTHFWEGETV
jgi:hypothetical protein